MRTYLYCDAGFVEKAQWLPNSWVNVVCPNNDDFEFLTQTLNVPESFLNDIADTDERPRTDTEGNWLLTILRIPRGTVPKGRLSFGPFCIGRGRMVISKLLSLSVRGRSSLSAISFRNVSGRSRVLFGTSKSSLSGLPTFTRH